MDTELSKVPLYGWLRRRSPILAAKVMEVREEVTRWLTYVPKTFAHFTSHTIDHSDEIIRQISNLLMNDTRPTLAKLSPIEAYVMMAGALLHDAGMVVSDEEKERAISSAEWNDFIARDDMEPQYAAYVALFSSAYPGSPQALAADRTLQVLLADFFRRKHHSRAGTLVLEHSSTLGRLSFGDSNLAEVIANVCEGHGLRTFELNDDERFPLEADIRGELINVRFCALLLRLGDLLDLRTNRACPLLLSAAAPLPPGSLAHWTQYSSYKSTSVNCDHVRIRARCQNADEDRVIREWCAWIQSELQSVTALLDPRSRHGGWRPAQPHIDVKPDSKATYRPVAWKFQLDDQLVFERLIKDAYSNPFVFIRELIQNGLDATRCVLYVDNDKLDSVPSRAPATILEEYKISVELRTVCVQGGEDFTEVIVEDWGIGMTESVILNNLLQVGRSYYRSDEFRREYSFVPTSRFGIGFLSCFADSISVELETLRDESKDGPILLNMTGPRNFLLVENGTRRIRGTRVKVRLAKKLDATSIVDEIRGWCRRVEFPIELVIDGEKSVIKRENLHDYECTLREPDADATFNVKGFPISAPELDGEFYLMTENRRGVELWFRAQSYSEARKRSPFMAELRMPGNLISVHGITASSSKYAHPDTGLRHRIDLRGKQEVDLARSTVRQFGNPLEYFRPFLQNHLTSRSWDTDYLEHIASQLPELPELMGLEFIPMMEAGRRKSWSPEKVRKAPKLLCAVNRIRATHVNPLRAPPTKVPYLVENDGSSRPWWKDYLHRRSVVGVYEKASQQIVLELGPYLPDVKQQSSPTFACCGVAKFIRPTKKRLISSAMP